ncbi:MAG: hypothetical protein M3145_13375, partial [Pseudomonadota bacterium]|nr:hypothetical protein [Pseudomonadota bacterium]
MSEYQYYEFRAIDRPLEAAAQKALRALSTRARITAHSFVNTYSYGDFKGDPRRLMEQWFDLHVYWANWGTRTLMLRAPRRFLDPETVRPYFVEHGLEAWTAGEFTILHIERNPEESPFEYLDDDASLGPPLIPLRAELLRGDRRCLYLGWLLTVQDGLIDDDTPEPPRPPGLGQLSGPLESFTEFFGLDPD